MPNRAIMIQWGLPVPGRERPAIEEFSSYQQWANRLVTERKIERFEVYLPHSGTPQQFAGFTVLEGNDRQIDELADSDDFRVRMIRVESVAQNVHVAICDANVAVVDRMKLYATTLQQLKL